MRVGLKVLLPFTVNKDTFAAGKFIPDEIVAGWDPAQLSGRLNNGYVTWQPIPDDAEQEQVVDIDGLDKDGLLEYAAQTFPGMTFDKRLSLDNLRQQVKAIKERAELLGNRVAAQAGRSGDSSAKVGGRSSSASSSPAAKGKPAPLAEKSDDPPAADPDLQKGADPSAQGTDGAQGGADTNTGSGGGSPQQ